MIVSYERIISTFLTKITEYRLLNLPASTRDDIVGTYLRQAVTEFSVKCREPIIAFDNEHETLETENDIDETEFVDIITDGMVYYWFTPMMHNQDILELNLNTTDFTAYSPAELLKQVRAAYTECKMRFRHRLRAYSYDHGDLTDLHI